MIDPRVSRGLERQLAHRRQLISTGRSPLGWKAAFGAPTWLQRLNLDGPVVGFLTDTSVISAGAELSIEGWARPVAEPELAVYLGVHLPADADETTVRAAIAAVGAAIELADVDQPPDDLEQAVAGNLFHKAVVLGAPDPTRRGGDITGLEAMVRFDGADVARTNRLEDLTGRVVDVISHLSRQLADQDEVIRAGDVVICGSVVPPLELTPGTLVEFELHPMSPISVRIR